MPKYSSISAQLCAKHGETAEAVEKLISTSNKLKYEYTARSKTLLDIIASSIEKSDIITQFYDGLSMEDLREICNTAKNKCKYLCIILTGNDDSGYSYCIYSDLSDLSEIVKCFNKTCNGSGGGRGNMQQGRVRSDKEQITNFFTELKV